MFNRFGPPRLALVMALCALRISAQPTPAPLQAPWDGVPDRYRHLSIPKFPIPKNSADWSKQRPRVKSIVVQSLGAIPPRPAKLAVRTLSTEKKDGYRIEKFEFDNGVDSTVPGYLAIPDHRPGKLPAILTMHGHGSRKENMFGQDPTSQDVAAMLCRRGYVVIGIDNYFNGERKGTGPAGKLEMQVRADQEESLFKYNLWFGRTLWGMMLRDEQLALDYLVTRPEVDTTRIGAQGMSMGATRAWWLAAIDDRVKAVVAVACFTRYEDLIAIRALRAHGIYYFVNGLLQHFDTEGVMALLAPRPFLALTGDRDAGSPPEGMKTLDTILTGHYTALGHKDRFQSIVYPNTGHVYTDDMKDKMGAWFDRFLQPKP